MVEHFKSELKKFLNAYATHLAIPLEANQLEEITAKIEALIDYQITGQITPALHDIKSQLDEVLRS